MVTIQTGWQDEKGNKDCDEVIDIPTVGEDHAHEIWSTIITGFDAVTDTWEINEQAPGFRRYLRLPEMHCRKYISVYINHV